jgi:hypothetical protein
MNAPHLHPRLVIAVLATLVATALVGCQDKVPEPEPKARPTVKAKEDKPPPPKELVKEDLVVGKGPAAAKGDKLKVHYTGRLYKNGKKFDSSVDSGKPFPFTLGQGSVSAIHEIREIVFTCHRRSARCESRQGQQRYRCLYQL